jgi:heptosyltransferase-2
LIFGSSNEDELRKDIIVKSGLEPDKIIGIPYGSVLDSAALISKLEAFICCDTLLTHIAAAMQIPQLVIMGPTPHTSVYPYNAPHKIIRADIDCSPCYGYSRKGIKCTHENKMKCLKDITPEVVVQKLRDEL